MPTDQDRFEKLLATRPGCVRMVTLEEEEAVAMVHLAALGIPYAGDGTGGLMGWTAVRGVYDALVEGSTGVEGTENAAAAMTHLAMAHPGRTILLLDVAGHLKDDRTLRAWRELVAACGRAGGCVVMIDAGEDAPPVVATEATRFDLSFPAEEELEQIVRATLQKLHRDRPIKADITRADLRTVIRNLRGLTRRQARRVITDVVAEDRTFDIYDLNEIMALKRQLLRGSGLLEYVEAPVNLDAVGGMRNLKRWLRQRADAESDEARGVGIESPRGVLILGVQGAGKSLCAKAIATAWQRPLLRMDVGALYDRYIGESERRLREAFRQAEAMAPIILWIDEVEKAFASVAAEAGSSDGGLSRRMFGMLLTWMQEHRSAVFLVATANDIAALPAELMRKGRFDEIFFVDLPCAEAREEIFRHHLAKRKRDAAGFDVGAIVNASEGYTGAEIEQAVVSALHEAFQSKAALSTEMVVRALEGSPPLSVTMFERVAALRAWAEGRCVMAD
jgi:MoxR-like ATPase